MAFDNNKLGELRPNQIITTFGPGSVVDAVKDSVTILDISYWKQKGQKIIDGRLASYLGVDCFYMPRTSFSGDVPVVTFPYWHVCSNLKCGKLFDARKYFDLDKYLKYGVTCPECHRPAYPSRFITICEDGHMSDFPWKWYMGCLVNFKTEKPSYKTKHSIENPIEKQAIFENHHEPIIDTQTWERVQELRKQRKRPNRYDEVGLFSGMLFCADCGSVMYQQRYQTDKRKQDCYICGNYKKRTHDCTAHFIRTDLLTAGVLSNLRKVTSYAAKYEARFVKLLIEQNEDGGKRRNAAKKKELEAAEKRIGELSAIFKRLYEDSVSGRISDERFTELSADYEAEQQELKERVARIQAELSKAQEATVNAEKFMNIVRKHMNFEELTHTLLREFVEKIVVHECSYDENGTRRQDIEIYYSFVGKVDLPE